MHSTLRAFVSLGWFFVAVLAMASSPSPEQRGESIIGQAEAELNARWESPGLVSATPPATAARLYLVGGVKVLVHFQHQQAIRVEIIRGNVLEGAPTSIPEIEVPPLLRRISGGTWKAAGVRQWINQCGHIATLSSPEKESLLLITARPPAR